MKIKQCFITNSSSASYIINKNDITGLQLDHIRNYIEIATNILSCNTEVDENGNIETYDFGSLEGEDWSIYETEVDVEVFTRMDDFNMYNFLLAIGIDRNLIKGGSDN